MRLYSYRRVKDNTQKFLDAILNNYFCALPPKDIDIYKPFCVFDRNRKRFTTVSLEIMERKSVKFLESILKIPTLTFLKPQIVKDSPIKFNANILELSIAYNAPIDQLMKDTRIFDPTTKTSPLFTKNSLKIILEIVKSRESEQIAFFDSSFSYFLKSIKPLVLNPELLCLYATADNHDRIDPQRIRFLRWAIENCPKKFVMHLLQFAVHQPYFKDLCDLYRRRFGRMDKDYTVELLKNCIMKGWKNWDLIRENTKSLIGSFDIRSDLDIWELALNKDSIFNQSPEHLSLLLDLDTVPEFEFDLLSFFIYEGAFEDTEYFFMKLLKKENYPEQWRNDIIDFLCTPIELDTNDFEGGLEFLKDSTKLQEIITQIVGKEFLTQNIESLSEFYFESLSSDDESDWDSSEIDKWSGNLLM